MEESLKNLDQRTARVEQVLPTLPTKQDLAAAIGQAIAPVATRAELAAAVAPLATKAELAAAIAPLATKAELAAAIAPLATKAELAAAIAPLATKVELAAAIAPLATKAELREEGERTRRHFDVVAERLESKIELIAEARAVNTARLNDERAERQADVARLDLRVTRVEASPRRPR